MKDSSLGFSDKQTLATADSTNTINMGHPYSGTCGYIEFVGHGITSAVTAIAVTVKDSADGVTFANREAFTITDIKALNKGYSAMAISKPLRQYVKISYAVTGTADGQISAHLTNSIERPNIYPATSGRSSSPQ